MSTNFKDSVYMGDDYDLSLVYKQANGTPVDLTGGSASLKIALNYTSSVSSYAATNSLDSTGALDFTIPDTTTLTMGDTGKDIMYILNVEVIVGGKIKTILAGILEVKRAI